MKNSPGPLDSGKSILLNKISLESKMSYFFKVPTLIGHSFAAPWAMTMKRISFESPKLCLLTLNSKNSIAAFLTPVRSC